MHNFSVLLWDVGTSGSYLLCLSDFLRNDIDFTEEKIFEKGLRSDVVYQPLHEIASNNEYVAGFCNHDARYWYQYIPNILDTRDKTLKLLQSDEDMETHIKCHDANLDKLQNFVDLLASKNYKTFVNIQSDNYESLLLMHYKKMGNASAKYFNPEKFIAYPLDIVRHKEYQGIVGEKLEIKTFKWTEIFSNRSKFNDILKILSGGVEPTDIMWNHSQEYCKINDNIISWVKENYSDVVTQYEKYYIDSQKSLDTVM